MTPTPVKPWEEAAQQAGALKPWEEAAQGGPSQSSKPWRYTPPGAKSVPMKDSSGKVLTDEGTNVPMGTGASIATAPLKASKALLESSGQNVTQGVQEFGEAAKEDSPWNPIPSSRSVGGLSKVARGVGQAALPIVLGANPVATVMGAAAGIPVAAGTGAVARGLGVPEGYAEGMEDLAGAAAGYGVTKVPGMVKRAVSAIDPIEGIVKGLKPTAQRTGFTETLQRSLPELKATEPQLPGKKITGVDDLLAAIDLAKKRVWDQYKQMSGPYAKTYTDTTPIADAMESTIPEQLQFERPEAAAALRREASVYRGKTLTVEQLENFLKTTNAELDAYYAKNPIARRIALGKNPDTAALEAKAGAIRDALYNAVDASGEGAAPREMKQRYGALLEMERAAWPRRNVAARQQPNNLVQQFGTMAGYGNMAKGALKLLGGNFTGAADVASGITEKEMANWIKEQQTTDALIRRSFESFQGQPTPVQAPAPFRPKGLLTTGDVITPPPADNSYVRSVPAMAQPPDPRRALPPATTRFTPPPGSDGPHPSTSASPLISPSGPMVNARSPIAPPDYSGKTIAQWLSDAILGGRQ